MRLIVIYVVLTILGTTPLFAGLQGQALIDSIVNQLPRQKEDTNKVILLIRLSFMYSNVSPDEGIKYAQRGLALSTKLDWKKGIAWTNNSMGSNYVKKSDYPKALSCYFQALKIAEEIADKKGIAALTCNIGRIYEQENDFPKALEYFLKALKLDEEGGFKQYAIVVTGNIGGIYNSKRDYPKALEYHFKALKMSEEIGSRGTMATSTSSIGNVYWYQRNFKEALSWNFKALQMFVELGDKYKEAGMLANIGSTYLGLATEPEETANVSNEPELQAASYKAEVTIPHGTSALLHKAKEYLNKAITMHKQLGTLDGLLNAYSKLSLTDSLLGDYKGALEARDNYHAIKDSVFSLENKEEILKMTMKNDYDRQRLTDSLKVAEKQKIASINLQKQKNYTYLGVAGICLLAGFSFFIVRERGKSETARKQSDDLLLNILPEEVATELKTTGTTTAKHFDNVTVLFTDFVNFTQAGEKMSPQNLIDELHTCFKKFDEIADKYNIEKIKTIGDAYLAVAGMPTADPLHAENIVRAAQEITAFMEDRLGKLGTERTFQIRIGVHSGSVVAGIVGVKKFAYDIWGDTVNTAARMEQNSEAGKINISQTTYELVKDKVSCEYRGEVEAKGKGVMKMYYVSAVALA